MVNNEPNFTRKSFLVVDDEDFSRLLLTRMIGDVGHPAVYQGTNGIDAVQKINQEARAVDAVISDLSMPKVNGLQLLKAIRTGNTKLRHDIPFAMVTGHAERDYISLAKQLDVSAFIVKPVSRNAVINRLQQILSTPTMCKPPHEYQKVDVTTPFKEQQEMEEKAAHNAKTLLKAKSVLANAQARSKLTTPAVKKDPEGTSAEQKPLVLVEEEENAPPPIQIRKRTPKLSGGILTKLDDVPDRAILARDIVTSNGSLLVAAGTLVSPRLIRRLRYAGDLHEPVESIWILPPTTKSE